MSEPETSSTSNPTAQEPERRFLVGLSARLLALTIVFVMLAEVLVFVPSVANFRLNWLRDRMDTAKVVAIALGSTDSVPREVQDKLLAATGATAIALRDDRASRMLAMAEMPPAADRHVDMRAASPIKAIVDAFDTLAAPNGRTLRVTDAAREPRGALIEVVISETPLRAAMLSFARNIVILSLVISCITAALVYVSLRWMIVRPMQRLTRAMARFRAAPEDPAALIEPSGRADEIGDAERRFAAMQRDVSEMLAQRRRLADLGLAVSKINHDLRNILAAAQLFTDRLAAIPDQTVQRLAPKIVGALDRAIGYSQAVLGYGKAREAPPKRLLVHLSRLVDDVGELLGLPQHPTVRFENEVPTELEIDADPDQLFRVLLNLCRNAREALEANSDPAVVRRLAVSARRQGGVVTVRVADTGPGIPEKLRASLFKPFQASGRKGGTGLGLAIAAELVRAHGGTIELVAGGAGATFEITVPDRPVDLDAARRAGRR